MTTALEYKNDLKVFLYDRPLQFGTIKTTRFLGDVIYIPSVGYVVNDAAIARKVLEDTEHFSTNGRGGLGDMTTQLVGHMHALINTQGEEHRELRGNLMSLFSNDSLEEIVGGIINQFALNLEEKLKSGIEVDISEYIHHCTSLMVAHLVGLPESDYADKEKLLSMVETVNEITKHLSVGKTTLSKDDLEDARTHESILIEIIRNAYENPDLPKRSLLGRLREIGIPFDHAKSIVIVILVAGTETVSSSFPRVLAALIDSGQWQKLIDSPELLSGAIDEGLRFTSPAPVILHGCIADTIVDSHEFKANRRVIIGLHNILHDPKYTKDPNTLQIDRTQNPTVKNLWFGTGPHMCLGFFLAKKEFTLSMQALLRVGRLEITTRTYAKNTSFPSYGTLIVRKLP